MSIAPLGAGVTAAPFSRQAGWTGDAATAFATLLTADDAAIMPKPTAAFSALGMFGRASAVAPPGSARLGSAAPSRDPAFETESESPSDSMPARLAMASSGSSAEVPLVPHPPGSSQPVENAPSRAPHDGQPASPMVVEAEPARSSVEEKPEDAIAGRRAFPAGPRPDAEPPARVILSVSDQSIGIVARGGTPGQDAALRDRLAAVAAEHGLELTDLRVDGRTLISSTGRIGHGRRAG
jgi:hypothetical protein